jgi:hydroxyacylglutathione hydrolase
MRHQGLATIPTSIGLEKKTNPYLRTHLTRVREAAERYHKRKLTNPRDVFIAIRAWKDQFREDFGVI